MKKLLIRITSDTPTFFKQIRKAGLSSIGIGAAVLGLPAAVSPFGLVLVLPALIGTIAQYLIVGGIAVVKIASTAVKDPSVIEEKAGESYSNLLKGAFKKKQSAE